MTRPACATASASQTPRTASVVAPAFSAAVPAAWITGPSASGSENGTPSSTRSRAAVGVGQRRSPSRPRCPGSRPSGRASAPRACRVERGGDPLRATSAVRGSSCRCGLTPVGPHWARTSARSLSPRPDRQSRSQSDSLGACSDVVERVGGLERRDDALEPRDLAERGQRLGVGRPRRRSRGPESRSQACSGPEPG